MSLLESAKRQHPHARVLTKTQEAGLTMLQVASHLKQMQEAGLGVSARTIYEMISEPISNALSVLVPKFYFEEGKEPTTVLIVQVVEEALKKPLTEPATLALDPEGGGPPPPTTATTAEFLQETQNAKDAAAARDPKGSSESKGSGLGDDLSSAITDAVTDELVKRIHAQLTDALAERISTAVTRGASRGVTHMLADTLTHRIAAMLVEVLTLSLVRLPTREVTKWLIPTLTHTLAPVVTHAMRHSPKADYYCWYCKKHKVYCDLCRKEQREDGEIDYYANYYAEYYGHYYTFYYGNYHADVFTEEYFKHGRRSRLFMPHIVRRPENFAKGKHPGAPHFPVKVHKTSGKDMQEDGPHAKK